MPPRSPVPQEVSQELERVVRRWQQLPLDHALSCMPRVRLLVDDLAVATAPEAVGAAAVPDLGPAAVMDQLTVLVYDACGQATRHTGAEDLAARLADLRRALST